MMSTVTEWVRFSQRRITLVLSVLVLVVLVVAPLGMLTVGSFLDEPPGQASAVTLDNYGEVVGKDFAELLGNSVLIAVGSTLFAMLLGAALAVTMVRTDLPWRRFFGAAVLVPAYVTPFIGAICWTVLLSPDVGYINNWLAALGVGPLNIYSMPGIIWVLGLYLTPVAYLYLLPALLRLDRSFEEAGRATGATMRQTARHVILPLLRPAVLSAALIILVQAIGDFAVPAVLGRHAGVEVITTEIVRMTGSYPADPNGAAVFGIVLAVVTLLVLGINHLLIRRADFTTITSRGVQLATSKSRTWRVVGTAGVALYLLVAIVLPLGVMLVASFQPYLTTDFTSVGLTFANYEYVASFPAIGRAIRNSVVLALGAAVTTTLLGVLLGYLIARAGVRGAGVVNYLSTSPLAIPHTVFGLAMLWTWVTIPVGIYGSPWILFIAYVGLFLPFSVIPAVAAFRQVDPSLEDAARLFGTTWLGAVRKVVIPLIAPALLSGAIIVIYHAVRELSASILLYTPNNEVISVSMFSMLSEGRYVQVFALSVVNVGLVLALVAVSNVVGRRYRATTESL
ncbi:ABC transporter permease [Actinophytocola sp.]|uniref:ABC transporter permease n=1 Tax=Actinophytocola sp. TaxID=1872138 RepID=UPI003D6B79B5